MAKKKAAKGAIVHLVLDKSGSMSAITGSTIAGVNEFVRQTAEADPTALYSLTTFDTEVHKVVRSLDITDVTPLDGRTYRPGGGTALLDGVGAAIKEIDDMPDKPSKIVVVIMTDGQENSSREYTREAIRKTIEARETDGWQFLFLGANVSAFHEAGAIGMAAPATRSFTRHHNDAGNLAAYNVLTNSTSSYLSGATPTANVTQADYDAEYAKTETPKP